VKSYVWSITDRSGPSGKPDECASARARAIARDEGGYTPFAYVIPDLQAGTYAAAIAHERDNHGTAGPDWMDLIRPLFEGLEIPVVYLADDINKHSALAIRFMDRDSRRQGLCWNNNRGCSEGRRGPNQSHLYNLPRCHGC
jgi:hypothetical protein